MGSTLVSGEVGEEDYAILLRLFEAMEKVRENAATHGVKLAEDFLVHLWHGEATKKASGKIADAYQSRARGGPCYKWCKQRDLQVTTRFGLGDW